MRTVLLLGATGLVGRELLAQLLHDPDVARVTAIVRRPIGVEHPALHEQIVDLDAMEQHEHLFAVDQIFCALGTTIKAAGSQERFRHVDHDLPLLAARLGRKRYARHYLLVSSLGADEESRIFYSRVKGETENDLRAAGYPSVTIARPSMLLGERSELRMGEEIAKKLHWLLPASLKGIHARDVARALVEAAREDRPGTRILTSRDMRR